MARLPSASAAGLLGRRFRLVQLSLALAATAAVASCRSAFLCRFQVPAAALQCLWAAAAAVADVQPLKVEASSSRRWALRASLAFDMITAMATLASASAALSAGNFAAATCAREEPKLCSRVAAGAATKAAAFLAWAALQAPAVGFLAVHFASDPAIYLGY